MPLLLTDLDDTIGDRAGAFASWAAAFAREHALDGDAPALMQALDHRGTAPREAFFATIRERFGLGVGVDTLMSGYRAEFPRHYRAFPGAIDALQRLRDGGWTIAIVTNGGPHQHDKLRYAGLVDLIDACCISEMVDVRKPDPRIFEIAASMCDRRLDDAWMVGDGVVDVQGARAAGIRSAWINHGRRWLEPSCAPDLVVRSFAEAVDRLLEGDPFTQDSPPEPRLP